MVLKIRCCKRRCHSATSNLEYHQWYASPKPLIVKLCGDRDHRYLMRATKEKLDVRDLKNECYFLYDDLVFHMKRKPFLFIGYSLNDPFIEYARQLVEVTFGEGKDSNVLHPRDSYIVTFDLPDDEMRKLKDHDRLIAINLDTSGRSKEEAVHEFLMAAVGHLTRQRKAKPGEDSTRSEMKRFFRRLQQAKIVPVLRTGGDEAKQILKSKVIPAIKSLTKEAKVHTETELAEGITTSKAFNELIEWAVCAVFIFDKESSALEEVIDQAMQLNCRAIILCKEERNLSYHCTLFKHERFESDTVHLYITTEINLAARADTYFGIGDYDTCVMHTWIAVENFFWLYTKRKGGKQEKGKAARRESLWDYVNTVKKAGGFKNLSNTRIKKIKALRNKVEHDGYIPNQEEAETSLVFAKNIVRSLTFDLPRFVSKMDTFSEESE